MAGLQLITLLGIIYNYLNDGTDGGENNSEDVLEKLRGNFSTTI